MARICALSSCLASRARHADAAAQAHSVHVDGHAVCALHLPELVLAAQMPLLKHTVYVEMAVLFAPIICQATRTVEHLTKEPLSTPGSVTIFRHCVGQVPIAYKYRWLP